MSEEQVEYVVDNVEEIDVKNIEEWKIDKLLEEVKANNDDLARYKEIKEKRINEIENQFKVKEEQIKKQNHYKLTTLREYAMLQDSLKSTKTQYKLPLLSGNVIIKKPVVKLVKPNPEQELKLATSYPDLIEKVESIKLDWKELKKKLVIQDGKIYDKESGEELTKIIDTELKEEEVSVN